MGDRTSREESSTRTRARTHENIQTHTRRVVVFVATNFVFASPPERFAKRAFLKIAAADDLRTYVRFFFFFEEKKKMHGNLTCRVTSNNVLCHVVSLNDCPCLALNLHN